MFSGTRIATLLVLVSATAAQAAPAPLISYGFDEGTGTTSANSGTVAAGADLNFGTAATWGTGLSGGAGDHAYLGTNSQTVPNADSSYARTAAKVAELDTLSAMTITAWVKTTNWSGGGDKMIVHHYANQWPRGFWFATTQNGNLNLNIGNNGDIKSTVGKFDDTLGQWTFVAVSRSGASNSLSFFYGTEANAVALDSTVTGSGRTALLSNLNPLYVGNSSTSTVWYNGFGGSIDDLRIYGASLSAAEVEAVRASAVPEPGMLVGLLGGVGMLLARRRRPTAQ